MTFELKRLTTQNLSAAIAKANQYRDLNQPEEADSICRDVLDVDAGNQDALRILGLSLTDRFSSTPVGLFEEAVATFQKLASQYERVYYAGIAWERAAKAHLERGEAHSSVEAFEHAMELFERAEDLAREGGTGTPDPVLRYNRCVRILNSHSALRAASEDRRSDAVHVGD
jgi:tetratricopeptide (TPR) repeat protein